jgi:hypothetical protein
MSVAAKLLDVICLVLGPVSCTLGFVDAFRYDMTTQEGLIALNQKLLFYPKTRDLLSIGIGVGLICFGFVIRSWKGKP